MNKLIYLKPLVLIFLSFISLQAKDYGNITINQVTSIYDGDTFRATIKDYPPIIGERMSIRVNGIDTPEMRGKCEIEKVLARKAKQQTANSNDTQRCESY